MEANYEEIPIDAESIHHVRDELFQMRQYKKWCKTPAELVGWKQLCYLILDFSIIFYDVGEVCIPFALDGFSLSPNAKWAIAVQLIWSVYFVITDTDNDKYTHFVLDLLRQPADDTASYKRKYYAIKFLLTFLLIRSLVRYWESYIRKVKVNKVYLEETENDSTGLSEEGLRILAGLASDELYFQSTLMQELFLRRSLLAYGELYRLTISLSPLSIYIGIGNMLPFLIFHISRLVWVVRRYLEAEVYFQQTVHFLAYYENEGKVKPVPYQKAQPKNHIILWCTGKFIEFFGVAMFSIYLYVYFNFFRDWPGLQICVIAIMFFSYTCSVQLQQNIMHDRAWRVSEFFQYLCSAYSGIFSKYRYHNVNIAKGLKLVRIVTTILFFLYSQRTIHHPYMVFYNACNIVGYYNLHTTLSYITREEPTLHNTSFADELYKSIQTVNIPYSEDPSIFLDDGYIAMRKEWSGLQNSSVELFRAMKNISLEMKLDVNETVGLYKQIREYNENVSYRGFIDGIKSNMLASCDQETVEFCYSEFFGNMRLTNLTIEVGKEPIAICKNGTINISVVSECQSCQFNSTLVAFRSFEKFCTLKKSSVRMNHTFAFVEQLCNLECRLCEWILSVMQLFDSRCIRMPNLLYHADLYYYLKVLVIACVYIEAPLIMTIETWQSKNRFFPAFPILVGCAFYKKLLAHVINSGNIESFRVMASFTMMNDNEFALSYNRSFPIINEFIEHILSCIRFEQAEGNVEEDFENKVEAKLLSNHVLSDEFRLLWKMLKQSEIDSDQKLKVMKLFLCFLETFDSQLYLLTNERLLALFKKVANCRPTRDNYSWEIRT